MMILRTMMILKTMIILKIMMIIRQFEEIGDFENLALWMTGSALYTRWLVVVQLLAENEPRERILYIFSCIRSDQNWERILRIFPVLDQNCKIAHYLWRASKTYLEEACSLTSVLVKLDLMQIWNFFFYVCLKTFYATLRKYTQSQKNPFHHDSFSTQHNGINKDIYKEKTKTKTRPISVMRAWWSRKYSRCKKKPNSEI